MKFASSGQEKRYLYSYFWNQARIEKDLFKFSITGQESRILTIKIPFQEEIKIFENSVHENKQEARNTI